MYCYLSLFLYAFFLDTTQNVTLFMLIAKYFQVSAAMGKIGSSRGPFSSVEVEQSERIGWIEWSEARFLDGPG